ncbi:LHCA9 [Auxenochlorella protothecoides x Auxenochlorella symbiontica]
MMLSVLSRPAPVAVGPRPQQRRTTRVHAAQSERTLWLPGAGSPPHLDGSLPGDFGFDPLNLGNSPDRLKWFAEGERINGRWAMAAVAGILGVDLLGRPAWFEAGALDYWMPAKPLLAIEFLTLGFLELKRYQGWKETGSSGFLNSFPFDPAGLDSPSMRLKEIKNGRLAMIAFIGFVAQATVTRQTPLQNLTAHLSSPFDNNILTSVANLPSTLPGA